MERIWAGIKDVLGSFNNNPNGWSARKLAAFTGIVIASVPITYMFTNAENLVSVLHAWLIFSLLCLGIITLEQLIRFKSSVPNPNIPDKEITTTVTNPDKVVTEEKIITDGKVDNREILTTP